MSQGKQVAGEFVSSYFEAASKQMGDLGGNRIINGQLFLVNRTPTLQSFCDVKRIQFGVYILKCSWMSRNVVHFNCRVLLFLTNHLYTPCFITSPFVIALEVRTVHKFICRVLSVLPSLLDAPYTRHRCNPVVTKRRKKEEEKRKENDKQIKLERQTRKRSGIFLQLKTYS